MRVIDPGHQYELDTVSHDRRLTRGSTYMQFVKREEHNPGSEPHHGLMNQEVLRVLIDRVKFLDEQNPCVENGHILKGLRTALFYHELRAYTRKQQGVDKTTERHTFKVMTYRNWAELPFRSSNIETYAVGEDGHILDGFVEEESPNDTA